MNGNSQKQPFDGASQSNQTQLPLSFAQHFFDTVSAPQSLPLSTAPTIDNSNNNTFSCPQLPVAHAYMQLPLYQSSPLGLGQPALSFGLSAEPTSFTQPPTRSPRRALTEREQFLVFVKILLKCLKQAHEDRISQQAKSIVFECTRRHRRGEVGFSPLQGAVEKHLRTLVGDRYWTRAQSYYEQYCVTKGIRRIGQAAAV